MLAPLFNHFLPNSRVVERLNILTPAITILLLFIVGCKYFSQNHFDDIKLQNKDTNWKRYEVSISGGLFKFGKDFVQFL